MTEMEQKVIQHDEQISTINRRLDKMENIAENLNKVSISLEKLNMSVSGIVEVQKKQATDIESLKLAPGKTAKDMWITIAKESLKVIVALIIGALIALIIKK